MVTWTRCIDMYLIGPFPRPQLLAVPRPQLLAVPRPQFSFEGCYLPLEPPLGQQRSTTQSQRFERHATTRRSRSERPERNDHHRYPHDVEQPGIEKANVLIDVPPRTDETPRNDPIGPRTDTTDRRDGRNEHDPRRAFPGRTERSHHRNRQPEAAPWSAANRSQPREDADRSAVPPSRRDGATTAEEQHLPRIRGTKPGARIATTPKIKRMTFIIPTNPQRPRTARTASSDHTSTTGTSTTKKRCAIRTPRATSGLMHPLILQAIRSRQRPLDTPAVP